VKVPLSLLEDAVKDAQEDLESAEIDYATYTMLEHDGENEVNDGSDAAAVLDQVEEWPPKFSKFDDKFGYNGRVLSKFAVDSVATTVFNQRKAFIEAKMKGLCASILKIDFNYKLSSKIRVWTKQGNSFCPFKCIVTVQNKDGQTVFWKALKHGESFTEILSDLIRLRESLNRNATAQHEASERKKIEESDEDDYARETPLPPNYQSTKVVYVDNCCNVKNIVRRCFPSSLFSVGLCAVLCLTLSLLSTRQQNSE
jgi:hypothetical protein